MAAHHQRTPTALPRVTARRAYAASAAWVACVWVGGVAPSARGAGRVMARWDASAQVGAGRVHNDAGMMLVGKLGYSGRSWSLQLTAPLWLVTGESRAQLGVDEGGGTRQNARAAATTSERASPSAAAWVHDWNDPRTYLHWLQWVDVRGRDGTFRLQLGQLSAQSLGMGWVVDRYEPTLDPLRMRTAGRAEVHLPGFELTTLVSGAARVRLVGLSAAVAPFYWWGDDYESRLKFHAELAIDRFAPLPETDRALGAYASGASVVLVASRSFAAQAYVAGGALTWGSAGLHSGLIVEGAEWGWLKAVRAKFEAINARAGYAPAYFDQTYEIERLGVERASIKIKGAERPAAGLYGRLTLDATLGPVILSTAVLRAPSGETDTALGLQMRRGSISTSLRWIQLRANSARDVVSLRSGTLATLEVAYQLSGGLFAYCHGRHGFRVETYGTVVTARDVLLGVGYAVGGDAL